MRGHERVSETVDGETVDGEMRLGQAMGRTKVEFA